ncbi:hypothetical protein JSY36_13630 [Bacillus sp. H-16]|uniref:F510_1955 family glycosylhydrolase n=1 Tax=Alteribacter salitolerans TaxID=2912333 RepID=UPI0019648595|nr:hypothetical protein [Alteribacter salitolerans]MBM7096782.1 hypothetical protein [Alteribacter salitolerans]
MKKTIWLSALGGVLLVSACQAEDQEEQTAEPDESQEEAEHSDQKTVDLSGDGDFFIQNDELDITHIHGLGYAGNEGILYVATHHGLALYDDGIWYETSEERNDYMGFSAVEDGFYTSGHPGEASSFDVDPIGLVKSKDGGKTLETLDLLGMTDFHVKGTGYYSNAIYVYNPKGNERLEETGFYRTLDDAETWEKREGEGLPEASYDQGGYPNFAIAVHPSDEDTLAVGTSEGLFLSNDSGGTFERTGLGNPVIAATYYEDDVYAGIWDGEIQLVRYDGEETTVLKRPDLQEQDAIQYIAVNPQDDSEMVFTTFHGEGYLSEDGGDSWEKIIEAGQVVAK